MPHETQKAFTINSWIINGISCLENDIATQRLHRGGYLSHTNLTLTKSTCYARAGGCVERLNSPYLCKSSHLRGGNIFSPRREILIFAEKNTHLRGEKKISPHATGHALKVPPSIVGHLLRQSPQWEKQKIFMIIYGTIRDHLRSKFFNATPSALWARPPRRGTVLATMSNVFFAFHFGF